MTDSYTTSKRFFLPLSSIPSTYSILRSPMQPSEWRTGSQTREKPGGDMGTLNFTGLDILVTECRLFCVCTCSQKWQDLLLPEGGKKKKWNKMLAFALHFIQGIKENWSLRTELNGKRILYRVINVPSHSYTQITNWAHQTGRLFMIRKAGDIEGIHMSAS